ncbi:hypothetical protein CSKR_106695 [Clonorchis sinensis]|uniref:Uncharacterized protein n=1 Tax=Clonorchis sinensis TaxID=79923 RepID=A0A3R7D727_CLOSI|nr:hypothetical protein CSKR_106695 [Clonorchis sinensis]
MPVVVTALRKCTGKLARINSRRATLDKPRASTNLTKLKPHSPAKSTELTVQLHPFTSERFHALFTLSSKYFSTFPHGTCSLSDSCKKVLSFLPLHPNGPFTLFGPCQHYRTHCWTWNGAAPPRNDLNTTLPSDQLATGFGAGLFPVHSPLLRESLLVSFPPLSDMLKFSG